MISPGAVSFARGGGEAKKHFDEGERYFEQCRFREALECYQKALVIVQKMRDKSGEATVLNSMGLTCDCLGEYNRALDCYQKVLIISQAVRDRNTEARSLNNMGLDYQNLGDFQKALQYCQKALGITREIGERAGLRRDEVQKLRQ
jgi:tetratricopeptide (TPR) repeat protein